jgi:hypothetical protein
VSTSTLDSSIIVLASAIYFFSVPGRAYQSDGPEV